MNTIIENIRNDNRNSFKQLFKDYYPILCIFANKYVLDEEASKDIAQEVLLTYWERRKDFADIYKVKGFLYTATRNRCLNYLKHEQIANEESYTPESFLEFENKIEDEIIRQETYLLVRKAVEELPNQMKRIVKLSMCGKKNSEIAAELSIAEGTVHALKKAAYKKLRKKLKEHFYLLFLLPTSLFTV